jgi:hypothetical protein
MTFDGVGSYLTNRAILKGIAGVDIQGRAPPELHLQILLRGPMSIVIIV